MAAPALRVYGGDPFIGDRARGFITLPRWILSDPKLSPADKAVLTAIIDRARGEDRTCTTPNKGIAAASGVSRPTVTRSVRHLVAEGYLSNLQDEAGETWIRRLKFDPKGLDDTRPPLIKSDHTPDQIRLGVESNLTRPLINSDQPSYRFSETQLPLFRNSPLPPKGEGRGARSPRARKKTRRQEVIDSYREWANEQHEEEPPV